MYKVLWRTISDLFTRAEVYSEPSQIFLDGYTTEELHQ